MSVLTGRWGSCNASCLARVGVKRREVECRDRITELLSDDCNPERRPIDTRRCYHRRQCANDKSGNCTRQKESVIKRKKIHGHVNLYVKTFVIPFYFLPFLMNI